MWISKRKYEAAIKTSRREGFTQARYALKSVLDYIVLAAPEIPADEAIAKAIGVFEKWTNKHLT